MVICQHEFTNMRPGYWICTLCGTGFYEAADSESEKDLEHREFQHVMLEVMSRLREASELLMRLDYSWKLATHARAMMLILKDLSGKLEDAEIARRKEAANPNQKQRGRPRKPKGPDRPNQSPYEHAP